MAMPKCKVGLSALVAVLLVTFECLFLFAGPSVQSTAPAGGITLKVGDPAPDFELPDQNNKKVHLSDFKGKKNVVLAFYVLAFTGG